jgi:hypothetical protein
MLGFPFYGSLSFFPSFFCLTFFVSWALGWQSFLRLQPQMFDGIHGSKKFFKDWFSPQFEIVLEFAEATGKLLKMGQDLTTYAVDESVMNRFESLSLSGYV